MNKTEILEGLGFKHEMRGASWDRWRHCFSGDFDKEFALIIYDDHNINDILARAASMLRKVGQKQKLDQITKFID